MASFTLFKLLLELISFLSLCLSETITNQYPDSNDEIVCNGNEDCDIVCTDEAVCQDAVIICPPNYACTLSCRTARRACRRAIVRAELSTRFELNECTDDDGYSSTCSGMTVYWPDSGGGAPLGFFNAGDAFNSNIQPMYFYAINGWEDIDVTGYTGDFSRDHGGYMYCGTNYGSSCDIETSPRAWTCDTSGALTCNGPTPAPSSTPSSQPTAITSSPTSTTNAPTQSSDSPSTSPTSSPSTLSPSSSPTTPDPSSSPTTGSPSSSPSTSSPSLSPTTASPSLSPTANPSTSPSASPTTDSPSKSPSQNPSFSPTTGSPSSTPTMSSSSPSAAPTTATSMPSNAPSSMPSTSTSNPSNSPSRYPSTPPTTSPVTTTIGIASDESDDDTSSEDTGGKANTVSGTSGSAFEWWTLVLVAMCLVLLVICSVCLVLCLRKRVRQDHLKSVFGHQEENVEATSPDANVTWDDGSPSGAVAPHDEQGIAASVYWQNEVHNTEAVPPPPVGGMGAANHARMQTMSAQCTVTSEPSSRANKDEFPVGIGAHFVTGIRGSVADEHYYGNNGDANGDANGLQGQDVEMQANPAYAYVSGGGVGAYPQVQQFPHQGQMKEEEEEDSSCSHHTFTRFHTAKTLQPTTIHGDKTMRGWIQQDIDLHQENGSALGVPQGGGGAGGLPMPMPEENGQQDMQPRLSEITVSQQDIEEDHADDDDYYYED